MSVLAFDTSAAVPLVVRSHNAHLAVRRRADGRSAVLTAHSLAETYSVLTRLPGDARVSPTDAVRLIAANFGPALLVPSDDLTHLPRVLAPLNIAGGAVYDALVGLAARSAAVPLATRDARAMGTYAALGVEVEVLSEDS
ncbi:type II toxin-antitoxin system VapC family toxin [Blastococcus mobilis]|uniref:Ribonuclease VapC n=1 Tax=Blastococcus mobilis TaxID=1938746 RepID=A0A238WGV0_9ACTN|nr:type II toxin-antitoxin system VapC family toxin [Blastococcus mobilis]SNR45826.1 PIN domain-containing protein [Blastococcus mobilis]